MRENLVEKEKSTREGVVAGDMKYEDPGQSSSPTLPLTVNSIKLNSIIISQHRFGLGLQVQTR